MKEVNSRVHDLNVTSNKYSEYLRELEQYFLNGVGSTLEKLESFPKYVPRTTLTRFLARYEIFKRIINIQGSIVECGVFLGGGLMTWAQLSSILEPANHQRKVIGFDTFSGFPSISENDKSDESTCLAKEKALAIDAHNDILKGIEIFDKTRYFNHIKKVEVVKGDIVKTVPEYIKNNPHLVISLLYLDADIFEPTKTAIVNFFHLMPKGGILAFDELAQPLWPGETQALVKTLGINRFKIERFSFGTSISFIEKC